MTYYEIKPGKPLQPYVKCYYVYESASSAAFEDMVFPSGCMEIIFNMGSGHWQTLQDDAFVNTPPVELWGQLARPLPIRSLGRNTMLGVRLYPHAAVSLLHEKANGFNNQVTNLADVLGNSIHHLHEQLQQVTSWIKRTTLLDVFLLQQLSQADKIIHKAGVIKDIMYTLRQQDALATMETIASRYGMTARYMQQLFVQHTGLTPKLYSQINRFQHSLRLVTERELSLTSIAYECGYADQSHFIKEFKAFTGSTPSGYSIKNSPVTLVTHQSQTTEMTQYYNI